MPDPKPERPILFKAGVDARFNQRVEVSSAPVGGEYIVIQVGGIHIELFPRQAMTLSDIIRNAAKLYINE